MAQRLSNEDCEIRRGRGIPFRRFWHIPFAFVILMMIAFDTPLIERCTGLSITSGKGAGIAGALLALPCSVYLPSGGWWERSLFAALLLCVPFAILNHRWWKRHEGYWDEIRERDTEHRAKRRRKREQH